MPVLPAGSTVGLFGGSFDPPHAGHLLVAQAALRRLRLDRLWWLVSPGNPLKRHDGLAPLARRIALSRQIARDPRITVTAFEAAHALRYTADLVALLRLRRPNLRFVWIMGADSLGTFHLWQDWRRIGTQVPIAVVDRPGATLRSLRSPAALALGKARIRESEAPLLARRDPPAWVFLHGPRSPLSSTRLRGSPR
ncbi:nicotinate-nucleotide adenylyltransferase [Aureimonas leprariae]|uniref:Probable nicotinate-nucleotide adenylyltransferase n=1 Tax=Plantimonas leprariae TaxID=2615207 RepID=A0A7V7U188_9HYPH|nr:nicotinate-nucleotide adenylyltransferase [Aureimonas leprariae]